MPSNQKYFLSEEQRNLLLDKYDGKTETINELMKSFPGVPRNKIHRWAVTLGVTRRSGDGDWRWSEEEIEYLEKKG